MNKKHYQVLILGSGPAGCTAAIYAARANLEVALITGLIPGGQLTMAPKIANWPGEPEGISGELLMEKILKQVGNFNVTLISEEITKIDLSKSPFNLKSEKNEYSCTSLIIATGASPKPLDIPGEQIYLGRGVSTCAICDGFFYKGKEVIIAGGGNTAAEDALYLAKMAKQVTIVHRRDTLRAEEWLISQLKATPNIKWELNATVTEILGDDHGVTGVIIKKVDTQIASKIAVDGVFIAIGYKPNTELFQDQIITKQGYIKTGYGSLTATSLPGVFAAGDVVINNYRQAIVAAGLGCTAALDAKNFLLTVTNQ